MSTWMVVEDEPDIYAVLLAMFEVWGIEGAAFVDGTEALSWIDDVDTGRVRSDLPELAIIDIRLPGASGPEVAARLRESPILRNMVIVLITAYRLQPSREDEVMAQSDADLLLYKPLPRPDEFRRVLEEALARRAEIAAEQALVAGKGEMPDEEAADDEPPAEEQEWDLLAVEEGETLEDTMEAETFLLTDDEPVAEDATQPTEPVDPSPKRKVNNQHPPQD